MFLGSGQAIKKDKHERGKIIRTKRLSSQNLTPDELVTTHPRNIEIRYREVTSVEIAHQFLQLQLRFYVSSLSTTEQVIRFNLTKKQIPEVRRLLELALPSKTKEK